jgi:hypothetical protein
MAETRGVENRPISDADARASAMPLPGCGLGTASAEFRINRGRFYAPSRHLEVASKPSDTPRFDRLTVASSVDFTQTVSLGTQVDIPVDHYAEWGV